MIEEADIKRTAAKADDDAAELLAKPKPAVEAYPEECNADDGHGCASGGG